MAMGPGGATRVSLGSFAAGAVVVGDEVVVGAAVLVVEAAVSEPDDPHPASPSTSAATRIDAAAASRRSL
jgi:hypothetical protein